MMRFIKVLILIVSASFFAIACGSSGSSVGGSGDDNSDGTSSLHWAKSYGGSNNDGSFFTSIQQTSDGGYVIAGSTGSFGVGDFDLWVIKLSSSGSIAWQKTYRGTGFDGAAYIQQTDDGGYIVVGNSNSFGAFLNDFWILRLNSSGNITWQKTYGNKLGLDIAYFVQQTIDGGYIVSGQSNSFGAGEYDFWVFKLDSSGNIKWQKIYGGTDSDSAHSIQQTADGGYIVAGMTKSFGSGSYDFWIIKLYSSGNVSWQKTFGGTENDWVSRLQQTNDNGYIVVGETASFSSGNTDIWILKLNSSGIILWQKNYGGTGNDSAYSIQQTGDGGYIVAGETESFGAGNSDIWVFKLNIIGNIMWQKTYGGAEYDNAYSIRQTNDGGYIVAGETKSFGAGMSDIWLLRLRPDGTISPTAPPNIGADTSAILKDTTVVANDTSVTPADSTATVTDTTITGIDSNATVQTQASD